MMLAIDNVLISEEIVSSQFVCDLDACQGGCCVDGDAGAPLTLEEASLLEEIFSKIAYALTSEGKAVIQQEGTSLKHDSYGMVTPTIGGKMCAYGYLEQGVVKCGIEKAHAEGHISFKKPISCHLYPIRILQTQEYEALNFEPRETLCHPGCILGERLKVPVYQFLKQAIIRKYGEEFYQVLDQLAQIHQQGGLPTEE